MQKRRDVFSALADPTRRRVVELLAERHPRSAGDLAAAFPARARPGVSRHVRVLRESGLVRAQRKGREWYYELDAGPLVELREGWLSAVTRMHEQSLRSLRRRVEQDPD